MSPAVNAAGNASTVKKVADAFATAVVIANLLVPNFRIVPTGMELDRAVTGTVVAPAAAPPVATVTARALLEAMKASALRCPPPDKSTLG